MNKYEQLIEYIINDDEAKAKAVFHDIVVAKSREIYESLMDEEGHEQGGNPVEQFGDEVRADEQGLGEEDNEEASGDDEFGTDDAEDGEDLAGDDMGNEFGGEEGGEDLSDEEQTDRILDLEAALDELKSEFDKLMGDEAGEEGGDEFGGDDMGGNDMGDMGMGDDMGEPEDESMAFEAKSGSGNPFAKSGSGSGSGSGKKGSGSGSGSGSGKKSAVESIREYVEKVTDGHGAEKAGAGEGQEVGKGGSVAVNKNTLVAGKNDMGGTTANIAKGGAEQAPDGTTPKGKAGGFVKSAQEIDVAKRNVNKPGGNKGAQDYYNKKETSWEKNRGAEGQTTDGSMSVSKSSLIGSKK